MYSSHSYVTKCFNNTTPLNASFLHLAHIIFDSESDSNVKLFDQHNLFIMRALYVLPFLRDVVVVGRLCGFVIVVCGEIVFTVMYFLAVRTFLNLKACLQIPC